MGLCNIKFHSNRSLITMKHILSPALFAIVLFVLSSCVSHEEILYFENDPNKIPNSTLSTIQDSKTHPEAPYLPASVLPYYNTYMKTNYLVKPFDNLFIRINNFQNNTADFLNSNTEGTRVQIGPAQMYVSSFSVEEDGTIDFPLIGKVFVKGQNFNQIKAHLDSALNPYLAQPSSVVKLANFRVTILGEVQDPGIKYIYNDKLTLMQAIGHARGFTDLANYKKVKLIREGLKATQTVELDLTNPSFLTSEAYFMMPNDVIYVEPLKQKASRLNAQNVSLVISAISVAVLVANLIITQTNNN